MLLYYINGVCILIFSPLVGEKGDMTYKPVRSLIALVFANIELCVEEGFHLSMNCIATTKDALCYVQS